jgi:hypothetical protein
MGRRPLIIPTTANVVTSSTKTLPGFAPADTLLPQYSMIYPYRPNSDKSGRSTSSSRNNDKDDANQQQQQQQQSSSSLLLEPGIGRVEEVYNDWRATGVTMTLA